MDRKKFKRIYVIIALISAFFMFGTGIKKAEAAYIDDCALMAIFSGYYQGLGAAQAGYALYGGGPDYMWDAYIYQDAARAYAETAYAYAYYSSAAYAYDAYVYALYAYEYLAEAAYYAYLSYIYGDSSYAYLSIYYGGYGAYYLAFAQYYSAYLY